MALYVPHSIFHLARLLYVRQETFGPYYVTSVRGTYTYWAQRWQKIQNFHFQASVPLFKLWSTCFTTLRILSFDSFFVLIPRHMKGIPKSGECQLPRRYNVTQHTKTNKMHATVFTSLVLSSAKHILLKFI